MSQCVPQRNVVVVVLQPAAAGKVDGDGRAAIDLGYVVDDAVGEQFVVLVAEDG